jgi:membrane protease YdiL (CAAX protease family)
VRLYRAVDDGLVKPGAGGDEEDGPLLADLDAMALTRYERVRAAIVAGELEGAPAALARLDTLATEAEPGGALALEIGWLKRLYTEGAAVIPQEERNSLVDRHGWFGELAISKGMRRGDPFRAEVIGGGLGFARLARFLVLGAGAALLAGLAMLVGAVRVWRHGEVQSGFETAARDHRRVYLEMFVVFCGGFLFLLLMHVFLFGINAQASTGGLIFLEVLTWGLAAIYIYPYLRGVPRPDVATDLGLNPGYTVGTEIMFGVMGWLFSLPLAVGVSFVIGLFAGESESGPSGYPLFEEPRGGTWGALWVGVLSAVVWAPLVEEVVFRGALYRVIRGSLPWWAAVLITSAVFGFVHPYTTAGLVQVGVTGVVLGGLREWRGSLIAPITCYFLHNASIALVTIFFIAAID